MLMLHCLPEMTMSICGFILCFHSNQKENAEQMLRMKLVSLLLFRLHSQKLSHRTIKSICNVLSALLGSHPGMEDIRR